MPTFALAKKKKIWRIQKKCLPLHSLKRNNDFGALVQLVRMPACHAGGHEFEPRTHRKGSYRNVRTFFIYHHLSPTTHHP